MNILFLESYLLLLSRSLSLPHSSLYANISFIIVPAWVPPHQFSPPYINLDEKEEKKQLNFCSIIFDRLFVAWLSQNPAATSVPRCCCCCCCCCCYLLVPSVTLASIDSIFWDRIQHSLSRESEKLLWPIYESLLRSIDSITSLSVLIFASIHSNIKRLGFWFN